MHKTVLLRFGQLPLEIRPDFVCGIHPNEMKPKTSTIVNIFGQMYKVKGNHEDIKKILGWESSGLKAGFGDDDVLDTKDVADAAIEVTPMEKKISPVGKTENVKTAAVLSLD